MGMGFAFVFIWVISAFIISKVFSVSSDAAMAFIGFFFVISLLVLIVLALLFKSGRLLYKNGRLFGPIMTVMEVNNSNRMINKIPDSRIHFLNQLVELSKMECNAFNFDGFCFLLSGLWKRKAYKLDHVVSIDCIQIKEFETQNYKPFPKTSRWKFSRVDGGPDRRYSGNKLLYFTQFYLISIVGQGFKGIIEIYSKPGDLDAESAIESAMIKFCNLIKIHQIVNLTPYYEKYDQLYCKIQEREMLLKDASSEQRKILKVQDAFSSMSEDYTKYDNDLRMKYEDTQQKHNRLKEEIRKYEMELADINKELQKIIKELKSHFSDHEHLKTVYMNT